MPPKRVPARKPSGAGKATHHSPLHATKITPATKGRTAKPARGKVSKSAKPRKTAGKAAARGKAQPTLRMRIRPRTVTPYLAVPDAAAAIAWYTEAFGAKELERNLGPGGKVLHATVQVGDSLVYLSDIFPGSDLRHPQALGGTAVNLHIHHRDIDRLWQQAVDAGATVTMQLANQFWGERYGRILDPFGHSWAFGFEANLSEDEMERMQAQAMALFAKTVPAERDA